MSDETPGIATAGEGSLDIAKQPRRTKLSETPDLVLRLKELAAPGTPDPDAHEPELWRGRGLLYALGAGMIAWGIRGLWLNTSHKALLHTLRFLVVALIAHDGILAPAVFALGFLAVRLVPRAFKLPLQVGLLVGGVLTIMTIPLLRSPVRTDNSSINPQDYALHLGVVLACLAGGVVVAGVVRMVRQPRSAAAAKPSIPSSNATDGV